MDVRNIQINTERLLLIPVSKVYAQDIFNAYTEPVTTYMHYRSAGSLEDLEQRLEQSIESLQNSTDLDLVVLNAQTKEFLGRFSLEELDSDTPEMGGWLKQEAHGNGYGKEAAAALVQWANEHLLYQHLIWPCAKDNIASRKLAESIGGMANREYVKKNSDGESFNYIEYWIEKK